MERISVKAVMIGALAVVLFVQLVKFVAGKFSVEIKGRWAVLLNMVSSLAATIIAAQPADPWALVQVVLVFIGAGGIFSTFKSLVQGQPGGRIYERGRDYLTTDSNPEPRTYRR